MQWSNISFPFMKHLFQSDWFFGELEEEVEMLISEDSKQSTPASSMSEELLAKAHQLGLNYLIFEHVVLVWPDDVTDKCRNSSEYFLFIWFPFLKESLIIDFKLVAVMSYLHVRVKFLKRFYCQATFVALCAVLPVQLQKEPATSWKDITRPGPMLALTLDARTILDW